jgi:hypothetical protein
MPSEDSRWEDNVLFFCHNSTCNREINDHDDGLLLRQAFVMQDSSTVVVLFQCSPHYQSMLASVSYDMTVR